MFSLFQLKSGMGALASCMETARMASYMGASTEFTKAEGVTYDAKNRVPLPFNYPGVVYK